MARLAVHGISKYFGERALFTDLAFEIGERDRIGLVGDNGCGKTTLLRILMGEDSADGGEVIYAGWNGGYGYLIKIDHVNTGLVTYYAHCSELYVSVGDRVYKGEHIAAMGSTGLSTGPHLHFGVQLHGTFVDPLDYLP